MKFAVRPSAIHGQGLFATTFIPAETLIGRVEGTPTRDDGPHVLWLTEEIGLRVTNVMRYINHSDDANAAYYDDGEVVALRDIHPGEEITHHYDGDATEPVQDKAPHAGAGLSVV